MEPDSNRRDVSNLPVSLRRNVDANLNVNTYAMTNVRLITETATVMTPNVRSDAENNTNANVMILNTKLEVIPVRTCVRKKENHAVAPVLEINSVGGSKVMNSLSVEILVSVSNTVILYLSSNEISVYSIPLTELPMSTTDTPDSMITTIAA